VSSIGIDLSSESEESMLIDLGPHLACEQVCKSCGDRVAAFYIVEYGLVPKRLVPQGHRGRERTATYCMTCYEGVTELPVHINGRPVALRKAVITFPLGRLVCFRCQRPFLPGGRPYGQIAVSRWALGNCLDAAPLACFCPACTDKVNVNLPGKSLKGQEQEGATESKDGN
jgi:hypothetical protein